MNCWRTHSVSLRDLIPVGWPLSQGARTRHLAIGCHCDNLREYRMVTSRHSNLTVVSPAEQRYGTDAAIRRELVHTLRPSVRPAKNWTSMSERLG